MVQQMVLDQNIKQYKFILPYFVGYEDDWDSYLGQLKCVAVTEKWDRNSKAVPATDL